MAHALHQLAGVRAGSEGQGGDDDQDEEEPDSLVPCLRGDLDAPVGGMTHAALATASRINSDDLALLRSP